MAIVRKWIEGTAPNQPVSQAAHRAIAERLKNVRHFLPLAAKHADRDIENVHQLRVATRRAIAAIEVFREQLPKRRARKLKKQLQHIRRVAGAARDLDVLIDRIRERDVQRQTKEGLVVTKRLTRDRRRAQKPLLELHVQLKQERFERRSEALVNRVRWRGDGDESSFSLAATTLLRRVVDEFFAAASADLSDVAALHKMRICGKKLRYTMELLAGAFGSTLRKEVYPIFVDVQKKLGRINDFAMAAHWFARWGHQRSGREAKAFRKLSKREQKELDRCCAKFRDWWTPEKVSDLRQRFDDVLQTGASLPVSMNSQESNAITANPHSTEPENRTPAERQTTQWVSDSQL